MKKVQLWWLRYFLGVFTILSTNKAKQLGLKWKRNIYGDEINWLNCRSLWADSQGYTYRVRELNIES